MTEEPGTYHWIKSNITEDPDRWEIAFVDNDGKVWIFGISGWFPRSEIAEIGPEIERPQLPTGSDAPPHPTSDDG